MLAFLHQRWFLIALISVLVAGMAWPAVMRPFTDLLSSDAILASITFIMALPLETGVLWKAVRRPGPAWLGSFLNIGLAPPLGWLASRVLPTELAVGVILAATVPITLASAAVLTRRAGGNDAVAFLVTMITSLACFLVVPTWLMLLIGVRAEVNFGAIVLKLFLLVVVPIVVAQLLRQWSRIGNLALQHKSLLGGIAQIGILLMVLIGAVDCGERLAALGSDSLVSPRNLLLLMLVVTAVHSVLVVAGFALSRVLSIGQADAIAVAFAGSQKTLMVGAFLAAAVAPLAILPMVAYHAAQLVIDTLIADWLRPRAAAAMEVDPEL
jgi:solute carrier family 10 (sodium/bile acid cotransporter), member 7